MNHGREVSVLQHGLLRGYKIALFSQNIFIRPKVEVDIWERMLGCTSRDR